MGTVSRIKPGPNTRTAYLVAFLDTTQTPPVCTGAGIFSESARSLTGAISGKRFAFDVIEADGSSYEDAVRNLDLAREHYKKAGVFEWAFRIVKP